MVIINYKEITENNNISLPQILDLIMSLFAICGPTRVLEASPVPIPGT
jgi:hypothetical protein